MPKTSIRSSRSGSPSPGGETERRIPPEITLLVDASVDAACIVAPDLTLLHFNRAYLLLLGLREREMRKREFKGLCHEVMGLETCKEGCLGSRALASMRHLRVDEVQSNRPDLRLIVNAAPLAGEDGTAYAIFETYRDVSAESRMQSRYKELLDNERRQNEILQEEVRLRTRDLTESLDQLEIAQGALERTVAELKEKNDVLEQLALRDGLTSLYNHRSFQQRLREELSRAQRHNGRLSLVICDVDHFKQINDTHGHPAGDSVLRFVAGMLNGDQKGAVPRRKSDVVFRYGGEEFAILLVDTVKEGAALHAERLRASFDTAEPPKLGTGGVTLSFGVASFPDDAVDPDDLLHRADEALLRAKTDGRNRVVSWANAPSASAGIEAVRPSADARAALATCLRQDRHLSLITLTVTDLERIERHYGRAGADRVRTAFMEIAVRACAAIIPAERLVTMVCDDPHELRIYTRTPGGVGQVGTRYLEGVSDRLLERVEKELRDMLLPDGIALLRVVSGEGTQLFHPTQTVERQLERLIEYSTLQTAVAWDMRRALDKQKMQRLILEGGVLSFMQPIYGNRGTKVVGYEALARGPLGSPLESPLVLLDLAEDVGLLQELDHSLIRTAFQGARHLPADTLLFVNVLPATLSNTTFVREELPKLVADAGLRGDRVVLELSEREVADAGLMDAVGELRNAGFVLGLDDLGTRNANLAEIATFRPEWLKLDRALVRGLEGDPVRKDLISAVVDFARKQGSSTIAEGVETRAEMDSLSALGIEFSQGYLLGRPVPAASIGTEKAP